MSPNVWRLYISHSFSYSICHSLFRLHLESWFCMGNCTFLSRLPDNREVSHANSTSLQFSPETRESLHFKTSPSLSLLKGSCSSYAGTFAPKNYVTSDESIRGHLYHCFKLFKTFLVKHQLSMLWNTIEVKWGAMPGVCHFLTLILCILFLEFLVTTYHSNFLDFIKHSQWPSRNDCR